jgi:hypothetical protein
MTSDSQKSKADSQGERLPFEPGKGQKKSRHASKLPSSQVIKPPSKHPKSTTSVASVSATAIPEVVSKRMVGRMALFCGLPSLLGLMTFPASYWIVTHNWLDLPNVAVVLVSMGFFGLGVVGLSYGMLSASWDEDQPGSKLGWREFKTNLGRLTAGWRSQREQKKSE